MSKVKFKIFIAGLNSRNRELISNFREVCATNLVSHQHQIEVIDILKNMEATEAKKILATPTIIREKPLPEKRIIGDFRENSKAIKALNFLIEDLPNQK